MRLNKIYATRAELVQWNTALLKMARGFFEPEILEMIAEAEAEDHQRDLCRRAA